MTPSATLATPETPVPWELPSRGRVGMFCLIAAEAALFVILVVAYLFYVGKSVTGPTPAILSLPIAISVCLLSSSISIHLAVLALRKGQTGAFLGWWLLTILLGAVFLGGTAREWRHLFYEEGLSIDTNLFGTTYYSLVGLHALHVTVGLLLLGTVAVFALLQKVQKAHAEKVDVLSLYWHFVDAVWVVVFTVVYVIGR
jgi:cytochrome c oxidase subunit III